MAGHDKGLGGKKKLRLALSKFNFNLAYLLWGFPESVIHPNFS